MKKNCLQSVLVGLAVSLSQSLRAVDFHVTTAQELQNALTLAAANGADDTIHLAAGYYTGNFNFNSTENRSLVLQGEPGTTNTDITIDGAGTGRDMNLANSGTGNFTVKGITFLRNCGSTSIGALRIAGGPVSTLLLDSCRFLPLTNAGTSGMGLEIVSGQNATVTNCIAMGANGRGERGLHIAGVTANILVAGCTVATNSSLEGNYRGGLHIYGSPQAVSVVGNSFIGNLSGDWTVLVYGSSVSFLNNNLIGNRHGGAAFSATSALVAGNKFRGNATGPGLSCGSESLTLSNNVFEGNAASGQYSGGGASVGGTSNLIIGNKFSGNSGEGGGLRLTSGSATIRSNAFIGNSGAAAGGGVRCDGPATIVGNTFSGNTSRQGGGVYCQAASIVSGNTFIGNGASSYDGGGISFYYPSGNATISSNVFRQNSASAGGAIYADCSSANIIGNLVTKSLSGGGVHVVPRSLLILVNNTITDNSTAGNGGGLACQISGTSEVLDVYNNIIWGNSAGGNGADVWLAGTGSRKTFRYNDVHGMYGVWDIADNLLDVAPVFFDPVNGDYHLRSTSPCLDAGTNGAPSIPPLDLDGNVRTNGVAVDLGCYEFNNTVFHPADANQNWVITAAEYAAYAAAWKNSQPWPVAPVQIPADYVTRAGLLQNQGGTYHNDGAGAPLCWKPGTN
jgi:predicted outer membrane repeat protein